MTVGLGWIGTFRDGREHLYFATDSRVRGGQHLDACPKILTLPRSDCAICFAGDTSAAYPLMIQVANAIAAHQPARERALDIARLNTHLLRMLTDLVARITDSVQPFSRTDAQFLFGGYSWRTKQFRLWTIYYDKPRRRFSSREAISFHPRLKKAAFIGDWGRRVRAEVFRDLNVNSGPVYLQPLQVVAHMLTRSTRADTIGGPPQVVRITEHMNTRPLCVRWRGEDTLFGRPLFSYENVDYWIVDPFTGKLLRPRKFGARVGSVPTAEVGAEIRDVDGEGDEAEEES